MTAPLVAVAVPGRMPQQLIEYWVHGKGALKIKWGVPGDFNRCVRNLRKYFPKNPEGLCNRLHTRALGVPPGQEHAVDPATFSQEDLLRVGLPLNLAEYDDDADDMLYEEEAALFPMKSMWRGRLAPIGVPTGDRRRFQVGAITNRELPLPLRYQLASSEGHSNAVMVGRILGIDITDDGIYAYGDWLGEDVEPMVAKAKAVMASGAGGVSVDLDDVEMEVRVPGTDMAWLETEQCDMDTGKCGPHEAVITQGRVSAATLVDIPAFAEAKLEMYEGVDEDAVLDALDALRPEDDELAESCGCGMTASAIHAWTAAGDMKRAGLTAAARGLSFTPPAAAFADPSLPGPTPIQFDDDQFPGYTRIWGHVAPWDLPHVGLRHRTAPRSSTGYSYFHLKSIYTAEGDEVAVGNITFGGEHPDLQTGLAACVNHYANVLSSVAVVRVGEDRHGVWFSGVLLPHVDESTRLLLTQSQMSGDWRPVGRRGNLELIAALAVAVPGFPIVRERQRNGETVALVACATPVALDEPDGFSASWDPARAAFRFVVDGQELFLRPDPDPLVEAEQARRATAALMQAEFLIEEELDLLSREDMVEMLRTADEPSAHAVCEDEERFCRNPLHPGPCAKVKVPVTRVSPAEKERARRRLEKRHPGITGDKPDGKRVTRVSDAERDRARARLKKKYPNLFPD